MLLKNPIEKTKASWFNFRVKGPKHFKNGRGLDRVKVSGGMDYWKSGDRGF